MNDAESVEVTWQGDDVMGWTGYINGAAVARVGLRERDWHRPELMWGWRVDYADDTIQAIHAVGTPDEARERAEHRLGHLIRKVDSGHAPRPYRATGSTPMGGIHSSFHYLGR